MILQHGFDLPRFDAGGYVSAAELGGRARLLRAFNARLWTEHPAGVVVVDLESLAAQVGLSIWEDPVQWHLAKQQPGSGALPALVRRYGTLIRSRFGLSKKVLVLDLDNTLWGGVVGEDGVGGLQIGPPSAVGEAHAAFQSYVRELKERGILLAVCSKNNEADAREPFRKHGGMVLKESDFIMFSATWDPKPGVLRKMAKELNLGLDTFVFVDDSPVERERMRREAPEVAVVEIGADPSTFVASLHATGWFESLALSVEDKQRHANYVANAERARIQNTVGNVEEFLRGLCMKMYHGPFTQDVLDRVVQLLGKTNQFNLTTRRHAPEQVQRLMRTPGCWTQFFRLVDKFGDNGIIGLIIADPAEDDARVWEIDSFLMSCRVIGRTAEDFMLRALLLMAKQAGCRQVRGLFIPTAKNELAAGLYPRFGFKVDPTFRSHGAAYLWDLNAQTIPEVPFIEGIAL